MSCIQVLLVHCGSVRRLGNRCIQLLRQVLRNHQGGHVFGLYISARGQVCVCVPLNTQRAVPPHFCYWSQVNRIWMCKALWSVHYNVMRDHNQRSVGLRRVRWSESRWSVSFHFPCCLSEVLREIHSGLQLPSNLDAIDYRKYVSEVSMRILQLL